MTQRELSRRSGVNRSVISRLVTGNRFVNIVNIVAIAWALDVPVTTFQDLTTRPLPLGPHDEPLPPLKRPKRRREKRQALTKVNQARQDVVDAARELTRMTRAPSPTTDRARREMQVETNRRLETLRDKVDRFDRTLGSSSQADLF